MSAHELGFTFKGTLMMPFDYDTDAKTAEEVRKEQRWLRNWLKRTRKRFASGRILGPRTDIPLTDMVAGRSVRFEASDGTKAA